MVQLTAFPILIGILCLLVGVLIGMSFSRSRFRTKLRDAERVIKTELEREREEFSVAVHQHLGNVRKVLSDALEAHDKASEVVQKQLSRPIDVPKLDAIGSGPTARIEGGKQQSGDPQSPESQLDMLDSIDQSGDQPSSSGDAETFPTEDTTEKPLKAAESAQEEATETDEGDSDEEDKLRAEKPELGGLNGSHAGTVAG